MFEATGLKTDDDYEDNAVCRFARSLLASGDIPYAVEELEHRIGQSAGFRKGTRAARDCVLLRKPNGRSENRLRKSCSMNCRAT